MHSGVYKIIDLMFGHGKPKVLPPFDPTHYKEAKEWLDEILEAAVITMSVHSYVIEQCTDNQVSRVEKRITIRPSADGMTLTAQMNGHSQETCHDSCECRCTMRTLDRNHLPALEHILYERAGCLSPTGILSEAGPYTFHTTVQRIELSITVEVDPSLGPGYLTFLVRH